MWNLTSWFVQIKTLLPTKSFNFLLRLRDSLDLKKKNISVSKHKTNRSFFLNSQDSMTLKNCFKCFYLFSFIYLFLLIYLIWTLCWTHWANQGRKPFTYFSQLPFHKNSSHCHNISPFSFFLDIGYTCVNERVC